MYIKLLSWVVLAVAFASGNFATAESVDVNALDAVQELSQLDAKSKGDDQNKDMEVVNINSASAAQIAESLKGIGEKKAAAIVEYRDQLGGFQRIEQLLDVKGIGESTLEKNRSNIKL